MEEDRIEVQAAKLFLKAAAYIRKYGWQEEGMGEEGFPRCSMGALASACPDEEWGKDLSGLVYNALYEELNGLSLTQYNHKFQDGERVVQLYKRAAERVIA